MRIAAMVLGATTLLLLGVAGMQMSEVSSLRAKTVALNKQLSECRVSSARTPTNAPEPATLSFGSGSKEEKADPTRSLEEAFGAMTTTRRPAPTRPTPRPVPRRPAPDRFETVTEGRAVFFKAYDEWLEGADISEGDSEQIANVMDDVFDNLLELEGMVADGEIDWQDSNRELSPIRRELDDRIRDTVGDEVFRDMWRNTHVGKFLRVPRPEGWEPPNQQQTTSGSGSANSTNR